MRLRGVFNPASWAPVILEWPFLLLLQLGRSSELSIFIMPTLGRVLVWKHGRQALWEGGTKIFSLLFLCIWIPIVLACPSAMGTSQ